jgi:hypothetical protein
MKQTCLLRSFSSSLKASSWSTENRVHIGIPELSYEQNKNNKNRSLNTSSSYLSISGYKAEIRAS